MRTNKAYENPLFFKVELDYEPVRVPLDVKNNPFIF